MTWVNAFKNFKIKSSNNISKITCKLTEDISDKYAIIKTDYLIDLFLKRSWCKQNSRKICNIFRRVGSVYCRDWFNSFKYKTKQKE